jgi:CDP-diglyceride synthetase
LAAQLAEGAIAMLPLFFGLATHGLCIPFGALRAFARPISTSLFGANKTYRGILCVAIGTAVGFVVIRPSLLEPTDARRLALVGFCVGAAAMAAELPNSFLKRRLGIAPGSQARGARGAAFHVLDQIDLVVGAWAVLAWLVLPTLPRLAGSLLVVYIGHQLLSVAGYWLGMRTTAR